MPTTTFDVEPTTTLTLQALLWIHIILGDVDDFALTKHASGAATGAAMVATRV